jgi:predicted enzyme related to lactoylglutathione lyase
MPDAPRTTFYVQVPDINATLAKALSMGGETVMPRTDAGMVVMAQFRDPEGNVVGLVEGPRRASPPSPGRDGANLYLPGALG